MTACGATALRTRVLRTTLYAGLALELLLATLATAAPSVSGITGTLANGEAVTISGSGFGSTGPNIVLFDSFEKGTLNANISTSTNSADIANWSTLGNLTQTYSNTYKQSGSQSMKIAFTYSASGPHVEFSNVQNTGLFVSFWQYMPTGTVIPGESGVESPNWKWFWFGDSTDDWPWGSDYVTLCQADLNDIAGLFPADDTDTPDRTGYGGYYDSLITKGTWMRYTFAIENSTTGGYLWNQEVSADGHVVVRNKTGQITAHSDDPWNILSLPGYGRVDANSFIYYDDVYIATGDGARARVEIGNNASYSSCTKLALLTPTSWGATSVTATVRAGGFAAEDEVYLFVVDADNAVSSGYGPLTMGGVSLAKRLFRNVRLADPVE